MASAFDAIDAIDPMDAIETTDAIDAIEAMAVVIAIGLLMWSKRAMRGCIKATEAPRQSSSCAEMRSRQAARRCS